MKKSVQIIFIVASIILIASCSTAKQNVDIPNITQAEKEIFRHIEGDTITISSDETEYEIIIIEPGFNVWLLSIARPEGYYTQSYLENRNHQMVIAWNQRVMQPQQYDPSLYEMQVDYQLGIDYGYEVNYKLFNYFVYFQRKYQQRLGAFVPRI